MEPEMGIYDQFPFKRVSKMRGGVFVPAGGGEAGGVVDTGKASFSDDFNATLNYWTIKAGAWGLSGGIVQDTTLNALGVMLYNYPLYTTTQVLEIKFTRAGDTTHASYPTVGFRGGGLTNQGIVYVSFGWQDNKVFLYKNTKTDGSADGESPLGDNAWTPVNGHYYGIKVSGASNSLTVNVYDNGTGSDWANRATWSSLLVTWSGVDASDCTLGNYFGLLSWVDHADAVPQYDDYKAEDQ